MHPDTLTFLSALFAPCEQGWITLTAIHPDGQHRTPSRHIPAGDLAGLADAVNRLHDANRQGWGAYVAVAMRKTKLGRWRRGGQDDLLALPALFVDVDDPTPDTLERLQTASPIPSCITFTGGGYHAYWWLATPLTDFTCARQMLHVLAMQLDGDRLSPAQSMRLPGSHNTKPARHNILCEIVVLHDVRYILADFAALTVPIPAQQTSQPRTTVNKTHPHARYRLNPALLAAVTQALRDLGYRQSSDWLCGPCLNAGQHRHRDTHISFGFNVRTGYGNCFRCGSLLLKEVCQMIGLHPAAYGGLVE